MKGDPIPEAHHLGLHCQPNSGMEFDAAGIPTGVTRDAFRVDADGISSNWIEFAGGNLDAVCLLLATIRTARKSHRVGIWNVGAAQNVGKANGKAVSAIHDPIDVGPHVNPGHSLMIGILETDVSLLDQLALLVELQPFTAAALALK